MPPVMQAIHTARLTLEPQVAGHADEMFRVLSDPPIYTYENAPPRSVAWLSERFARLEARVSPDGREQWLNWVLRLSNGELIGYVQATVQSDGRALIGYELASRHWGRGLGSEAVASMMSELQNRYEVGIALAILKRANQRSLRLLQRLGFAPARAADFQDIQVETDEIFLCRELGNA